MRTRSELSSEELNEASRAALRGGNFGAVKYGLPAAILGVVAHLYNPTYRGLTIQFKVFLQLSAMTMGGWIAADRGLRTYELMRRRERKAAYYASTRRDDED